MAYDQYPAGSPVAGPVAALPWTERGVVRILDEVDPSKLILGMPFYTRLWTEEPGEEGKPVLKSKALSMAAAEKQVAALGVTPSPDPETEHREGQKRYKLWLETPETVRQRALIVRRYGLAGAAIWSRNFGVEEAWRSLTEGLRRVEW